MTPSLVGSGAFGLALPWSLPQTWPVGPAHGAPAPHEAFAAPGHVLLTAAFREAPASLIAPVSYMHLVWAAGLGWPVFGHLPDAVGAVGIAAIGLAGVLVALASRRPAAAAAAEG